MKRLTAFFFVLCICLPNLLVGQEDSKYLAGAVPEVDGKVVFTKVFELPGVAQDAIYDRIYPWLDERMKANENKSRVVYSQKNKGQIVASAEEYLVFSSTALALDRANMTYQVVVDCEPGKCLIKVERIRYTYQEDEKYTAEEQIADNIALNKDKTNIFRGYKKFRVKTIDFVDELFEGARQAFGIQKEAPLTQATQAQPPLVAETRKEETTPQVTTQPQTPSIQQAPVVATETPVATGASLQGFRQITPDKIPGNIVKMLSEDWMLITAGNDTQFNMMTASWGGLGMLYEKPTATCFINPTRYTYQLMEKNDTYTLTFYTEAYRDALQYCGSNSGRDTDKIKGSGLTPITTPSGSKAFAEAWLIIECRKLVGQSLNHDALFDEKVKADWVGKQLHKMYIGEIINVWVK